MKINKYILLGVFFLAVACEKNESQEDNTPYDVGISRMTQESATQGNVSFPQDANFGTYVVLNSTNEYLASNAKWSYDTSSSSWLPVAYPSGIGASGPATVYAYAPYNADVTFADNKISVNLPSDQATNEADYLNSDIMWAKGVTTADDNNLDLLFKHQMSKIIINLYAGTGFDELPDGNNTPPSNTLSLYFDGLKLSGMMNLTDGTITDLQPATKDHLYPRLKIDEDGNQGTGLPGNPKVYECIVLPQSVDNAAASISLMMDGALYTNELALIALSLEPGNVYNVNLTVNELGCDISVQSIIPWVSHNPDLGIFVRYNYSALVDLDNIASSGITSDTRAMYGIYCHDKAIIGDDVAVGAISHEYLFDSRLPNRKIVAEAIVAYAMTPDKVRLDTLDGVVLKVLKKFTPAAEPAAVDNASAAWVVPTENIHGGLIDNMIYADGTSPVCSTVYYYHNTVLLSHTGIPYDPFIATVDTDFTEDLVPLPLP